MSKNDITLSIGAEKCRNCIFICRGPSLSVDVGYGMSALSEIHSDVCFKDIEQLIIRVTISLIFMLLELDNLSGHVYLQRRLSTLQQQRYGAFQ